MATAEHTSESILGDVARHERDLLVRRDAVREEARGSVDAARADAVKQLQQVSADTQEEIASLRRESDRARESKFDAAVDAAHARLSGRRDEAMGRVAQVADRVMEFFLPKEGGA